MLLPLALTCALAAQNCPSGQYCAADFDPAHPPCPDTGECRPLPTSPEIELSLPIPAGESIYCAKGPLVHPGSHDACYDNARFALDLATPASEPPHVVLAAADGVAYVWDGCSTANLNSQSDGCNGGWGNYVHVDHGTGVFTHYAHLSAILVSWGERVKRGQPIGIEGNTGAAGGKHIHFSLHMGDPTKVGPSVPINWLRVKGRVIAERDLHCGDWTKSNDVRPETRLDSETARLPGPKGFTYSTQMAAYRMATSGDPEVRHHAEEALRKLTDPEARYWLGAALQVDGSFDESRRVLEPIIDAKQWIGKWARLRLAEIALAQHRNDDARKLLSVLDESSENEEFRKRLAQAKARLH